MKKLYILLSFILAAAVASAQDAVQPELTEKKQQDIEALKVAFISKELELTPDEAQKFWPVYNQYDKEIKTAVKENDDVIVREERVLNVRKKYREQFVRVVGDKRMNRMFNAENRFRQMLIKMIQRQQMKRAQRNNRPGIRN